jgi:hypothetical protein
MKKFTILHFSLLSLSLLYSFIFYSSIAIELAIMAIIFDLVKPSMFITALQSKGIKRNVFGILVIILVSFNLLAISSSFINKYNKESSTKTLNSEYTKQQDKLKQLKSNIISIETELNSYPTLEAFTSKSPKWEDKTQLNQTWQDGKKDINNRLTTAQQEYNKELSKKIAKYNVVNKDNGYNAIFTALSQKLNVKTSNLVLVIYILFAIMLEILIFYTKTLSVKEQKNYIKSTDEMTADLIKEMNYQLHLKQLQALKNSFDENVVVAVKEIVEQPKKQVFQQISEPDPEIETKLIEADLQENRFRKKVVEIENIKKYLEYLLENSENDIAIGYKKVAEGLGLTESEALRIFDKLKKKEYLETEGKKTFIKKEEFNESDFEEV